MKIDRLLGITVYLLNHGVVSASVLAEEFEVSVRTILRDIETLSLSGIPITSLYGSGGGYKILENYKLNSQLIDEEDYSYILTALQGLKTGLHNKGIRETFEKILHTTNNKSSKQNIFLDFSVMHEGFDMDNYMKQIEQSITDRRCIKFEYTDSLNHTTKKLVDPLALQYRWYAWYLLGYCHTRQDYRWYKVIRMRNLMETDDSITLQHEPAESLMKRLEETDNQAYINIKLKCDTKIKVPVQEYLRGEIVSENEEYFILSLKEPAHERMWYSLLMGFGNGLEVLEPDSLRESLKNIAKDIYNLYHI
jgi:predicted DNA-binding transcriptional regulator YafY